MKFKCTKSGNCCVSAGEAGFVFLTEEDLVRMENHLGKRREEFAVLANFDSAHGESFRLPKAMWHLKALGACQFLSSDRACGIYAARPEQCRTWPYWPQNVDAKGWTDDVKRLCPGVSD